MESTIVIANVKPLPSDILHVPVGLASIASVLRLNNHIKVVDNYAGELSSTDCVRDINATKPEFLLLSGCLGNYSYQFLDTFTRQVKSANPDITIIVGGAMATTIPELIIKNTSVDIAVIGEGERTIVELLQALRRGTSLHPVGGLCFRERHNIEVTSPQKRIDKLDNLPMPAYDLFPLKDHIKYLEKTNRCWELCGSRGCPHICVFCKKVFGEAFRYKSPEKVIEEMDYVHLNYGIDRFCFVDENFVNNSHRMARFCEVLKSLKRHYKWRFQGRVSEVSTQILPLMKSAGFFGVSFGLESGSPAILADMNKSIDLREATKTINYLADNDIRISASFIVGMPNETDATISETADFISKLKLEEYHVNILTPYPKTEIYDRALRNGEILDEHTYCYEMGNSKGFPYINLTKYPNSKLLEWKHKLENL